MNIADLTKYEKARSSAYKGLAECYHMPGSGLNKTLIQLERQLEALGSEASPHITLMRSECIGRGNEIDDLCVDFAKLFVGPYALLAPPYGSVYLDGERKIMGGSTMDVRIRYANAGLELSAHFKEPPDHIAAELEFMHFLIFKEIEATLRYDMDRTIKYLDQQEAFLENHLAAWVPQFARHVVENANTDFYKHLAQATDLFIKHEYDHILACTSRSCDVEIQSQKEEIWTQALSPVEVWE
ncbi:MAG: molecular chaperone TorD family protein [Deltaproteobacteria bacterium]|nr:molecular chaperone TorD family protein [Deltaproteobacteria bacterium]